MNKYPLDMPEEELKINVGNDYFPNFDNSKKIGKIDFCVSVIIPKNQPEFNALDNELPPSSMAEIIQQFMVKKNLNRFSTDFNINLLLVYCIIYIVDCDYKIKL